MAENILELRTLIERPSIKIDDAAYEIVSPQELSIVDSQRFTLWGEKMKALSAEGDDAGLEALINDIAGRIMVSVPIEVAAKLSGVQKMAVVEVFTALLLQHKMAVAGAITKTMEPGLKAQAASQGEATGETSSRASSASMVGRRSGGSSKRRSR